MALSQRDQYAKAMRNSFSIAEKNNTLGVGFGGDSSRKMKVGGKNKMANSTPRTIGQYNMKHGAVNLTKRQTTKLKRATNKLFNK